MKVYKFQRQTDVQILELFITIAQEIAGSQIARVCEELSNKSNIDNQVTVNRHIYVYICKNELQTIHSSSSSNRSDPLCQFGDPLVRATMANQELEPQLTTFRVFQ